MEKSIFEYRNLDDKELPFFGFKIHISATIDNYKDIFNLVEGILDSYTITYKYIRDDEDVLRNFSVDESPAESGKYITIYPENEEKFRFILDVLYEAIPIETEGIYILSDRPYKDSNIIFYRFGTIKWDLRQTEDGLPTIYSESGDRWQDFQKTYFDIPVWISDIQEEDLKEESYLEENYAVFDLLSQKNGGNVYRELSLLFKQPVILKEAVPHVLFSDTVMKKELRDHEFKICSDINKYVPKALEKVDEWMNTYYIYEDILGEKLSDYLKKFSLFQYSSRSDFEVQQNVYKFEKFVECCMNLAKVIWYFHKNGYILNDIHPDNFIVDNAENLYFIDLEQTYSETEIWKQGIFNNVSLKLWNNLDGRLSDCHKFANLILFSFARIQLKEGEIYNSSVFHSLLKNYGINSNFPEVISYLFSSEAKIDEAIQVMKGVYIKNCSVNKTNYGYSGNWLSKVELSKVDCHNYINVNRLNLYRNCINDFVLFSKLVDSEKKLSLNGLIGYLIQLYQEGNIPDDFLNYGIAVIKNKLVESDYGKMIPIDNRHSSPYLIDGNAGVIKGLMLLDPIQYQDLIIELANSLAFEYAQNPGYERGMLGIAEVLIEVYRDIYKNGSYKYFANRLLNNTNVFLGLGMVNQDVFQLILTMYGELEHGATVFK